MFDLYIYVDSSDLLSCPYVYHKVIDLSLKKNDVRITYCINDDICVAYFKKDFVKLVVELLPNI